MSRYQKVIDDVAKVVLELEKLIGKFERKLACAQLPSKLYEIPMVTGEEEDQYITVRTTEDEISESERIGAFLKQHTYLENQHPKSPLRLAGLVEAPIECGDIIEEINRKKDKIKALIIGASKASDTRAKIMRSALPRAMTLQIYRHFYYVNENVTRALFYWSETDAIKMLTVAEAKTALRETLIEEDGAPNLYNQRVLNDITTLERLDENEVLAKKLPIKAHPKVYIGKKQRKRKPLKASTPTFVPPGTLSCESLELTELTDFDPERVREHNEQYIESKPMTETQPFYRYINRKYDKVRCK